MFALSDTTRRQCYLDLGSALPPPPPALDTQEERERRFAAAIEEFTVLDPANAYEAELVVRIVVCGAYAIECLRQSGRRGEDDPKAPRCRAQAVSMFREARAAHRMLTQERKGRLPSAQRTEGRADQLQPMAVPATGPQPDDVPATATVAAASASQPPQEPAAPLAAPALPPPSPEALAKADDFARSHRCVAEQIRRDGRITPRSKVRFRAVARLTDPAVVDALIRGRSDVLCSLDRDGHRTARAA